MYFLHKYDPKYIEDPVFFNYFKVVWEKKNKLLAPLWTSYMPLKTMTGFATTSMKLLQ